jgi:hypothetical protein
MTTRVKAELRKARDDRGEPAAKSNRTETPVLSAPANREVHELLDRTKAGGWKRANAMEDCYFSIDHAVRTLAKGFGVKTKKEKQLFMDMMDEALTWFDWSLREVAGSEAAQNSIDLLCNAIMQSAWRIRHDVVEKGEDELADAVYEAVADLMFGFRLEGEREEEVDPRRAYDIMNLAVSRVVEKADYKKSGADMSVLFRDAIVKYWLMRLFSDATDEVFGERHSKLIASHIDVLTWEKLVTHRGNADAEMVTRVLTDVLEEATR